MWGLDPINKKYRLKDPPHSWWSLCFAYCYFSWNTMPWVPVWVHIAIYEATYISISIMDFKPLWLLDIDFFLNDDIEEGDLQIHLVDSPPCIKRYWKNFFNKWLCGYRRKLFLVVYSLIMREPTSCKKHLPYSLPTFLSAPNTTS